MHLNLTNNASLDRSFLQDAINLHFLLKGEGALINKHTSIYLDLKNRALVLQYLDIYVEESPIVSYENWRRYIFGSTSGEVTLTGL